jgi:transposase
MLREILDEHPDVNTLDEAEERAWTYVHRSTQDLRTIDSRTRFVRTCLTNDVKGIADGKIKAARAKRDLRVASEQEAAEADRLEQQRRKRAEQLAQEHEKANALERYRVEAAARAEAERVEDNKRRATLGLPLLEPGESVYGNRKAQP